MPTYQYACTSCGERLEVVQRFSDDPLTVCPACAGALRKVFSPVGVVFKGSGFYKTDSRSSSKPSSPAAKSDSSTGSGGSPASASGPDSGSSAVSDSGSAGSTSGSGAGSDGGSSGEKVA